MILFLISLILTILSSYLVASCYCNKKYLTGFLYTTLIAFAQVVLNIEILSLFGAISKTGILALNTLFLVGSIFLWKKHNTPLWRPQIKIFLLKILKATKRDKILAVMTIGLLFFMFVSLIIAAIYPVMAPDSLSYHLNRALFWVSNGNLNHFDISDDRNINMAINSEILYCWFFAFVKRNILLGLFSFVGYLFTITSLWSMLEQIGYSIQKRLWAVFMLSALAGVIVEASGTEMNVVTAGLMLCGVNLFLLGVKKDKISPLFFSSLSFALAIGTKSTALFIAPSAAIICLYLLKRYNSTKFWQTLAKYIGFFVTNVLLFAAYNYILNFLHFGNFMGSEESLYAHEAMHTVKGFISGFIRHFLLLFDFTGFSYSNHLQGHIFELQDKLLSILNIPTNYNIISTNSNILNNTISDPLIGGGVVGVVVFLPCFISSIFRTIFKKDAQNKIILALFGLSFFLGITMLSIALGYMVFSARFVLSFIVFASPIFVLSYIKSNKNIFKYVILFYVMSYFLLISTHIWSRPFTKLTKNIKNGVSITEIRHNNLCQKYSSPKYEDEFCALRRFIYTQKNVKKIGLFTNRSNNTAIVKFMENDGFEVNTLLIEKFNSYKLDDYDLLVFTKSIVTSSYIENLQSVLNNYKRTDTKLFYLDKNAPKCVVMDYDDLLVHNGNLETNKPAYTACRIPYKALIDNGYDLVKKIPIYDVRSLLKDPDNTSLISDSLYIFSSVK